MSILKTIIDKVTGHSAYEEVPDSLSIDKDKVLDIAKRVIDVEISGLKLVQEKFDENFTSAVEMILNTSGKVIVMGMGKSGLVCQKIAATMASTGTSSFFVHPAESAHGDLGMVAANDIVLAMSNSGETEEIIRVLPFIKRRGVKLIALTGKQKSTLAEMSDIVLDIGVKEEACPLGLAPTASTTAAMAVGDALAVALLELKGFKEEDFATLHPSGSLGKKLLRVKGLMNSGDKLPKVSKDTPMVDALEVMTVKGLGLTGVFDGDRLVGVITDGDLRRAMKKGIIIQEKKAEDVMTKNPKVISGDLIAEGALKLMDEHLITSLFVKDDSTEEIIGVVHLHDLIRAGVL